MTEHPSSIAYTGGTNLVSKIVIWMVDQKKVLHKLTDRLIRIWWNVSNEHLKIIFFSISKICMIEYLIYINANM